MPQTNLLIVYAIDWLLVIKPGKKKLLWYKLFLKLEAYLIIIEWPIIMTISWKNISKKL
jgi:hypothetical protein